MKEQRILLEGIPAVLYGEESEQVWLFVHGKSGCKEEGAAFGEIVCPGGAQVAAVDLPEHGERKREAGFDPWHCVPELRLIMNALRRGGKSVSLRANSIGAWFSMLAFEAAPPRQALFVSPVLDMEKLIQNMMLWAAVDEERLKREGEIPTGFGETLSWRYLQYVRQHPVITWSADTQILYAGRDSLTDRETVEAFACRFACGLTVMDDGEHWFHTKEQLSVLREWERRHTKPPEKA